MRLDEIQKLDVVLNIELREDILVKKISSRRVCQGCGNNYNLADIRQGEVDMPPLLPKVEGKCDKVRAGVRVCVSLCVHARRSFCIPAFGWFVTDALLLLCGVQCGGALVQRSDDRVETVRERLKIYQDQTMPLVEHFSKKGSLVSFQVKRGVADFPDIAKLLQQALAQRGKTVTPAPVAAKKKN